MRQSAMARTTTSSLNAHRSSIDPPPRATMTRSGRATAPALPQCIEAAYRGGDLRRRAIALDANGPDKDVRRAAIGEPVEDVADHRAGRRSDDADRTREEGQSLLAVALEQAFGGELGL